MLRDKVLMNSLPEGSILLIGAGYGILRDSQPRFAQLFVFRQVPTFTTLAHSRWYDGRRRRAGPKGDRGAEVDWEAIAIASVLEVEVDVDSLVWRSRSREK